MRCIYHCWKIVWSPTSQSATRKRRNLQPSTPSFWACAQAGASRENRSKAPPKRNRLCAKRGKSRWRPCVKAAKQPRKHSQLRRSAPQGTLSDAPGLRLPNFRAPSENNPRILAKFDPCGQILACALFSLWTVHGPFLFSLARQRKEKWGVHMHQPSSWLYPSRARPVGYRFFKTPVSSLKALISSSRSLAWAWTASHVPSVSYHRAFRSCISFPCCSTQV